jgi:hypothetical protein
MVMRPVPSYRRQQKDGVVLQSRQDVVDSVCLEACLRSAGRNHRRAPCLPTGPPALAAGCCCHRKVRWRVKVPERLACAIAFAAAGDCVDRQTCEERKGCWHTSCASWTGVGACLLTSTIGSPIESRSTANTRQCTVVAYALCERVTRLAWVRSHVTTWWWHT